MGIHRDQVQVPQAIIVNTFPTELLPWPLGISCKAVLTIIIHLLPMPLPLASTSVLRCISRARMWQVSFKLPFWADRLRSSFSWKSWMLLAHLYCSPTEGPARFSVTVLNFDTSPFLPTILAWIICIEYSSEEYCPIFQINLCIHFIFAKMSSQICTCLLCKSNKLIPWAIMHIYKEGYSKKMATPYGREDAKKLDYSCVPDLNVKGNKQFIKFF